MYPETFKCIKMRVKDKRLQYDHEGDTSQNTAISSTICILKYVLLHFTNIVRVDFWQYSASVQVYEGNCKWSEKNYRQIYKDTLLDLWKALISIIL